MRGSALIAIIEPRRSAGIFDKNDDEITSGVQQEVSLDAAAFPTEPFEMIMEKIDLTNAGHEFAALYSQSYHCRVMLYGFCLHFALLLNLTKENVLEITKHKSSPS